MSAENNKHLAQAVYQAFNAGDLERAVALADDDIVVERVPFDLTFHGKAGFRDFMQGFKTAFLDLTLSVVSQVASEDSRFCEVWTVRDGKIARLHNYQDAASWLRQLGLA